MARPRHLLTTDQYICSHHGPAEAWRLAFLASAAENSSASALFCAHIRHAMKMPRAIRRWS
eukprot:7386687-Prymnesium_polylepis.1